MEGDFSMIDRDLKPADFNFFLKLDVRFRDCDPMNHVNNAVYSSYLEQSRFAYFRNLGLDFRERSGTGFMLVETHIRFLAGARFGDELQIHIRVSEMKKARFYCQYLIERVGDGQKIVVAASAQVGMDLEKEKLASIDGELAKKIRAFEELPD